MDNSLLDVLVIVGAVLISVIGAVSKGRKKAAEKEAESRAGTEAQTGTDVETRDGPHTGGIPIPDPWQDLFNLPEEEDDFIPKNPETATPTPSPDPPKKERQPLISRDIEHEPRNYIEEMAKAKAIEREKKYEHSSLKYKHGTHELRVVRLDDEEDSVPGFDLGLDEEDAWKKAVIYHDLLEPKF